MVTKFSTYDNIISPIVTEKSTNQSDQNKIVFKVNRNFNKKLIKKQCRKNIQSGGYKSKYCK